MKTFKDYPEFKPNVTPRQMFELGVFGGTYFRDIYSGVNKKHYKNRRKKYSKHLKGIPDSKISSKTCNITLNHFKAKSGTSLRYWESKDWIDPQDPYGWVEWYINFYDGRRTEDDSRQIKRWAGIASKNGRFYKMLKRHPDSNVIKQLLLQWAVLVK